MMIIPAIDIMDRSVVRLRQGKFDSEKIYSENPVKVAGEWKDQGALILHIVDLDGARLGRPVNMDVIREIVKEVRVDIQLGGGLRTEEDIESAFRIGSSFAVIGTSAITDEAFSRAILEKFGEKIIFAVDVTDGKLAIKGWKERSDTDAIDYVKKLALLGAKRIIYTDISRDGMMQGPNLETLKSVLQATSLEVIASGGVSSLDDIKILGAMEGQGLKGIIVGKALYEGKINFKEALGVSKKNNPLP